MANIDHYYIPNPVHRQTYSGPYARYGREHAVRSAYFANNVASVRAAQASLKAILTATEGSLNNITFQEARYLYMRIQAIVPYRSGRLASSVRVDRISEGDHVVGFRAYAFAVNPETGEEYAVEQHENTQYEHAPGRTHHYISIPFEEVVGRIDRELKANATKIANAVVQDFDSDSAMAAMYRRFRTGVSMDEYVRQLMQKIPRYKGSVNLGEKYTPGMAFKIAQRNITPGGGKSRYTKGKKRSGYKQGPSIPKDPDSQRR